MSSETLELYETGGLDWPAFPPRTRLYPLAPIGIGTPAVESLTSYLTRLAHAHGVTVAKLAAVELAPLVNKTGEITQDKFAYRTRNLNGVGDWAGLTIMALEKLTLREDVRLLTLYPWRHVLSRRKLLRHHLAWCPACYHDWRQAGQPPYTPLLWTLEVVQFCPRHQQALVHHCPYADCHKRLPLINSHVKLGYCPACKCWLGDATLYPIEQIWSEGELQWQRWLTTQLAELLAATPHLPIYPEPHTIAHNLRAGLSGSALKSAHEMACQVGLTPSVPALWLEGSMLPQLDLLLKLCFHLEWQLLDVCLSTAGNQEIQARATETPSKSRSKRQVDVPQLSRQLESILADEQRPPCSVEQVAQQLGWRAPTLAHHCPKQYQRLVEQCRLHRHTQLQQRNEIFERDLKAILESDEVPPPSLHEVTCRLQINPHTLRKNFPDLCRLISQKRCTFYRTRRARAEAGLRSVLAAEGELLPSIGDVAVRLGEDLDYLCRQFPELCQAVADRARNSPRAHANLRSSEPAPHQSLPSTDRQQLRDQLAAIIAAEEKPPPSLPEVARRLGCSLSTLRKGYPDLCRQLAQQDRVYRQAQTSLLEAQVRDILAANETPPPSLPQVAQRLGTSVTTLGQRLPALCAEIVRRHQADRQMERQRRQAFLDQLIAENPATPPSLSQVAQSLGLRKTDSLPRRFPEASRLIAARYEVYQKQARASAEASLQAALNSVASPPPSLIQIAQQLGYSNSTYLQIHFPDLCHQLVQRCQASKQQAARVKLETFLASAAPVPTLSLSTISQRLGYHYATLKRLCPDLCQTITERYQSYRDERKRAVKQALEAVLSGERTPPLSIRAIAIEFGYTTNTLYRSFPDLTASVIEKHKTYLEERGQPGHI